MLRNPAVSEITSIPCIPNGTLVLRQGSTLLYRFFFSAPGGISEASTALKHLELG